MFYLPGHIAELQIDTQQGKDITKLDGEACNADGTLKEAEEMVWPNSPSDVPMDPSATMNRLRNGDQDDDVVPAVNLQRRCVSFEAHSGCKYYPLITSITVLPS